MIIMENDLEYDSFAMACSIVEENSRMESNLLNIFVENDMMEITNPEYYVTEGVKDTIEKVYHTILTAIQTIIDKVGALLSTIGKKIVGINAANALFAKTHEKKFMETDLSDMSISDYQRWDMSKYPKGNNVLFGYTDKIYETIAKVKVKEDFAYLASKGELIINIGVFYKLFATQSTKVSINEKMTVEEMKKEFHETYCTEETSVTGISNNEKKELIDILKGKYFSENRYKSLSNVFKTLMVQQELECKKLKNAKESDDIKALKLQCAQKYISAMRTAISNQISCLMNEDMAIIKNAKRIVTMGCAFEPAKKEAKSEEEVKEMMELVSNQSIYEFNSFLEEDTDIGMIIRENVLTDLRIKPDDLLDKAKLKSVCERIKRENAGEKSLIANTFIILMLNMISAFALLPILTISGNVSLYQLIAIPFSAVGVSLIGNQGGRLIRKLDKEIKKCEKKMAKETDTKTKKAYEARIADMKKTQEYIRKNTNANNK